MPLNARQIDTAKPKEKEYRLTLIFGKLVNNLDAEIFLPVERRAD